MNSTKPWIPGPKDPRWIFAALLTCYALVGSTVLGFNRDLWQILLTVGLCAGLDMGFARVLRGEKLFPLSGYITGLGLSLLVNYPHDYFLLVFPAFFAIASKYVLTCGGRHMFNPGLVGLMAALTFGGGLFATAPPYQWGDQGWIAALFLGAAALAGFVGNIRRTPLIVAFLVSFTLLTLLRAWVMRWHLPPQTLVAGTLMSPSFFLFTFYMITDPKTSPDSRSGQIAWGVAVSLLDFGLHFRSSLATLFAALFLVSAARWAWGHGRQVVREGWIACWPGRSWLKNTAALGLTGLAGGALYSQVLHPAVLAPRPGFVLERVPMEAVRPGPTLGQVDPRLAHIAKWVLSVGDAVAIGDYDGDGLPDLFLTYPLKEVQSRNALYHNDGNFKFTRVDLPALAEISAHQERFGLISGALFVDYDNSGRQSLLLTTGWGKLVILKNVADAQGKASFVDATRASGVDEYTVSVAATLLDLDRDGDLDLFVGNAMAPTLPDYGKEVRMNVFALPRPEVEGDRRPFHFMHNTWHNACNGGLNALYKNEGSGRFVKQNAADWGLPETHWTLAVGTLDVNRDGWPDLYCASDFGPDDLYLNREGKRFERVAGTFTGSIGRDTYKGMNVSVGDLDNSGELDVYVSNVHAPLQAEGSLAWHTGEGGGFEDLASSRRLMNEKRFGWGAAMGDLNLDGWLDLIQVNGMVDDTPDKQFPEKRDYWYRASQVMRAGPEVHSYADRWADLRGYDIWGHQQNRVYLSNGKRPARFQDVADAVGVVDKTNSRAVALADFDNDGDLDAVITHQFAPAEVLRNTLQESGKRHWIGFELRGDGVTVNRDAVGARVMVSSGSTPALRQTREVSLTSGFSAQGDRRLHFGLGHHAGPVDVEVIWTDGRRVAWRESGVDRYHRLKPPQ